MSRSTIRAARGVAVIIVPAREDGDGMRVSMRQAALSGLLAVLMLATGALLMPSGGDPGVSPAAVSSP